LNLEYLILVDTAAFETNARYLPSATSTPIPASLLILCGFHEAAPMAQKAITHLPGQAPASPVHDLVHQPAEEARGVEDLRRHSGTGDSFCENNPMQSRILPTG
jgi:hypothetical protein